MKSKQPAADFWHGSRLRIRHHRPPLAAEINNETLGFKLGIASYSFRKFPRADAIKMIQELKTALRQHQGIPPALQGFAGGSGEGAEGIRSGRASRS